jgi:hypothetical protein
LQGGVIACNLRHHDAQPVSVETFPVEVPKL